MKLHKQNLKDNGCRKFVFWCTQSDKTADVTGVQKIIMDTFHLESKQQKVINKKLKKLGVHRVLYPTNRKLIKRKYVMEKLINNWDNCSLKSIVKQSPFKN